MTKPKRQAKKPKARTIWVNELPDSGERYIFKSKRTAERLAIMISCWGHHVTTTEFREVLKKGKR